MGIFTRNRAATPPPSTQRSGGLFRRRTTTSSTPSSTNGATTNGGNHHNGGGGLFHRNRSPANSANGDAAGNGHAGRNVLGRDRRDDHSILAARQHVGAAEAAEREADRALGAARQAVQAARNEVQRLEREAAEESKLAKHKMTQATSLSKRARPLGKHDHV